VVGRRLAYAVILTLTVALGVPYTAAAAEHQGTLGVAAARVAAERQLVSLGIDPSTAVFQVGAQNYAGPECPGGDWNCTSAATVVQIATGAALTSTNNVDHCSDPVCTIVQTNATGGTNDAHCAQHTTGTPGTQSCSITQTNTTNHNRAFVHQSIHQAQPQGLQDGQQRARVTQVNDTGANESAILQTILQIEAFALRGPGTIAQTQEAHQRADVCQGGANTFGCNTPSNGKNVSSVVQSNVQRARVHFDAGSSGSITQHQNTDFTSGTAFGARPKSTTVVTQRSVGDTNDSGLLQLNRQVARVHDGDDNDNESDEVITHPAAFVGTVVQQQGKAGNPVCPIGGLCGFVAQDSTGVERAFERQHELQKVQGPPGATQNLGGPEFCCATQTGGNAANVNDVDQVKIQLHTSSLDDGKVEGHCESGATSCHVHLFERDNHTTQSNSCTTSPCNPTIHCTTTPSEGGGEVTTCTPGTAPGPLFPPCPSPAPQCVIDAPTRITLIDPLWLTGRHAIG
jgi:hypothetical protein